MEHQKRVHALMERNPGFSPSGKLPAIPVESLPTAGNRSPGIHPPSWPRSVAAIHALRSAGKAWMAGTESGHDVLRVFQHDRNML